jgi:hypothetical protein
MLQKHGSGNRTATPPLFRCRGRGGKSDRGSAAKLFTSQPSLSRQIRREPHAGGDIGDDIAVRVNLQLIDGLGREGLGGGGPRRFLGGGRVHVHDQDRLARVLWLGEGLQISEVQARVSAREPEVGTGVMVRHGSSAPLL